MNDSSFSFDLSVNLGSVETVILISITVIAFAIIFYKRKIKVRSKESKNVQIDIED